MPEVEILASHAIGTVAAVLFDLDGTLIDTTALIFESYQHALRTELGAAFDPDALYVGYGQPLPASFRAILGGRGALPVDGSADLLVDRLVRTYRAFNAEQHDRLARPFPGVREMLESLRARNVPVGLVTSKAREMALRGLDLMGLGGYFAVRVFMEDSTRHKPSPEPLWLALDRLGLRERLPEVVYVGDSIHDVAAGHAAGVRTAAALWGPFPESSLRELNPTYLLGTPLDVLGLLDRQAS